MKRREGEMEGGRDMRTCSGETKTVHVHLYMYIAHKKGSPHYQR